MPKKPTTVTSTSKPLPKHTHVYEDVIISRMFATRLKERMDKLNLSPWGLANCAKISESSVRRYLRGKCLPKTHTAIRLACALDCSVSDLLGV